MGSKKSEVLWNFEKSGIPKSHLGLIQIHSDKTATSPIFNALFAYLVHTVRLNLNAKQRRYLTDHEHTLLSLLPVWSEDMEIEGGDAELEKNVLRYAFN